MDVSPNFLPHNLHHDSVDLFHRSDPHLRRLRGLPYVGCRPLLSQMPVEMPGIYSVGGGRQVGKTTLLKQWMVKLLASGVPAHRIVYLTGELIDDHHALVSLLQGLLGSFPGTERNYVILDEVTYIKDWDRAVKYLADTGILESTVLILTGSDLVFLKQARMRFPGRRGMADTADFHLYPLSFQEFYDLQGTEDSLTLVSRAQQEGLSPKEAEQLFRLFNQYLIHGGYLSAINDLAVNGKISPATLTVYAEWLRGDILRRGKREQYLRELLAALVKQAGSQTTWHSLSSMTSIDHHRTVADYVEVLARMDALFVQPALQEHSLTSAPRKARKIIFTDPFILHSVRSWLNPTQEPYSNQIKPYLADAEQLAALVESTVVDHYRRYFSCYYIKGEGEVDIAYVKGKRFYPVEVKWTRQLRPGDLKQISKYDNATILGNTHHRGSLQGIVVQPLPLALLALCNQNQERPPNV